MVPVGEVEGWLGALKITGHAAEWLIQMFDRMGEEGNANYFTPEMGDVWHFVDSINRWLRNPARAGID